MQNNIINELLTEVKKNRKYSTISDEIILNEVKSYLKSNPNISKPDKVFIKEIRAKLHRLYSSYLRGKKNKRIKLLDEFKKDPSNINIINKILLTSVSAKERLSDYENLYKEIFKLTGKPKIIIDLGCGLNPLSYTFMNLEKAEYYAYDIDSEDIGFLNNYFEIAQQLGLSGKAQILNVQNIKDILKLPHSDIIFLFKLLDLIDKKNKNLENIILLLIKKAKFIIASFATRTISGKKMNLPRRKGFELMLNKLNLKYQIININNEIFYVICK